MPQTIVEKIAQMHLAEGPKRPLRTGDFVSMRPHHVMTHDNTSAVMSKFKGIGAKKIRDPKQLVFALDHDIQNQDESNQKKYRAIEAFAKEHGIDFYPAGSGIGHQIMVERGYVVPGSFVVASDSHSNMYGALGAIGTPIVRTDAAAAWATGEFWWQIPRSVEVVLEGELPAGATGKDVIITLCGLYNHEEVLNAAVEFSGPGVASLSMDARLTISNMTTEWGPLVGWFPVDDVTINYLKRVYQRLKALGVERFSEKDLESWAANPPRPGADAVYAARIVLDLSQVVPHVSGPDTVQVMASLAEMEKRKVAIQKAYLLSCVNSRLEDLEAAASVVKGKKVAAGVKLYLGAASKWVQEEAERRGTWKTLLDAGAHPLPAGCGPCIGLGVGLLEPGEVGISATNRNFKGRMGSRDAQCYLASPEVVAASAVAGYIRGPHQMSDRTPVPNYTEFATGAAAERVDILPGFPERVRGRLVLLPQDNVNTDAIYGKDYTYRDDVTPQMMAKVVMENYDPQFSARTRSGDIIVSGSNFGTGSSREQAVTALKAKSIPLVIAASFSQTYLRNAFNNGFLCIEIPELVKRLLKQFAKEIAAKEKTIIPADEIDVDFTTGMVHWREENFPFPALGSVPQSLVIAEGVENLVAKRLGLARWIGNTRVGTAALGRPGGACSAHRSGFS
jgi:homoaconitate hydratase